MSVSISHLADGRIQLSGKTFDIKDTIKGLKGIWNPADKTWTLPAGTDTSWLCPPKPVAQPQQPRVLTREMWQNYCLRKRGTIGPCCGKAVGKETRPYGPICYNCPDHGYTHNSYTGD